MEQESDVYSAIIEVVIFPCWHEQRGRITF